MDNIKRVAVALSGGVDSSVAAAILVKERGFDVTGITMRLWCEQKHGITPPRPTCCSIADIDDARRVCNILKIPFYVLDLETEFEKEVVEASCREYLRGRTPNPCIICNQKVKFGLLLNKCLSLGFSFLATGHYVRKEQREGKFSLLRGADYRTEQSYFLYFLGQRELQYILFPVGNMLKSDVRQYAENLGLPTASKRKSQDLCFIPNGNLQQFLLSKSACKEGNIVDINGKILGRHSGIAFYTIGQRHGLGLPSNQRLYVTEIRQEDNTIVVGAESDIFYEQLIATDISFVSGRVPSEPMIITAKHRYRSAEAPAALTPAGDRMEVKFHSPQRALTPGQSIVFYQGDEVIGGGIIERVVRYINEG